MTLLALTVIAGLLLWIADAAIGRPDRLDRHATVAERVAARARPGRVALTVAIAAGLPLVGLVQIVKVTAVALATVVGPHVASALAA